MNKIMIAILLVLLLVSSNPPAAEATKPSETPTPAPSETPTPAAPSYISNQWIGSQQPQEIAAILPLVDRTAAVVVWDAGDQSIHVLGTDFSGVQASDQNWHVGEDPGAITIAACGRDLWVGVNGTGGMSAIVQVQHFELAADVCSCSEKSILYIPIIVN